MWSRNCINRNIRSKNRYTFITVVVLGCFIFIVLLGYTAFGHESEETTLKQVHIIFRHGERTPSKFYTEDPYKNHSLWSAGLNELTNNGKHSMYEFGKTLRKRYKNFLSELYRPEDLLVLSSYAHRCQMSVLTLLAGLYPPKGDQIWNPDLLWQPIPINSVPRENDNMIAAKEDCPAFSKEYEAVKDEVFKNVLEEFKDLIPYLMKNTGDSMSSLLDIETLYFILDIEHENKLQLPEWTHTVYPDPLRRLAKLSLDEFSYNDKLKRLRGGPLLGKIFDQMKTAKEGGKVQKFFLYSGHDLTVNTLMRTLGIVPNSLPDFGATLVLELHYSHLEHTVSAFYYKNSFSQPGAVNIPDCGQPCELEKLMRIRSHLIPTDWRKECQDLT